MTQLALFEMRGRAEAARTAASLEAYARLLVDLAGGAERLDPTSAALALAALTDRAALVERFALVPGEYPGKHRLGPLGGTPRLNHPFNEIEVLGEGLGCCGELGRAVIAHTY